MSTHNQENSSGQVVDMGRERRVEGAAKVAARVAKMKRRAMRKLG